MGGLLKGLGQRIRQLRKGANLTQSKLADMIDIDPKFLGTIERGQKRASLEVLERLMGALKVEPYELFLFSLTPGAKGSPNTTEALQSLLKRADESTRKFLITVNASLLTWFQGRKV